MAQTAESCKDAVPSSFEEVLRQMQEELKALRLLEHMQQELSLVRASQQRVEEQWTDHTRPRRDLQRPSERHERSSMRRSDVQRPSERRSACSPDVQRPSERRSARSPAASRTRSPDAADDFSSPEAMQVELSVVPSVAGDTVHRDSTLVVAGHPNFGHRPSQTSDGTAIASLRVPSSSTEAKGVEKSFKDLEKSTSFREAASYEDTSMNFKVKKRSSLGQSLSRKFSEKLGIIEPRLSAHGHSGGGSGGAGAPAHSTSQAPVKRANSARGSHHSGVSRISRNSKVSAKTTATQKTTATCSTQKNNAMFCDELGPKYLNVEKAKSSTALRSFKSMMVRRVTHHGKHRDMLHTIVLHPLFEVCSAIILVLHTICIAAYVEYKASHSDKVHPALKVLNQFLVFVFVIEVILKAYVERMHFLLGDERIWNCFDIILVLMVVVEVIADVAESRTEGGHSKHIKSLLKIGEVVRFARVLRIFRMLRFSASLRVILSKIFNSMKTLFWVMILIFLLLFVVAICITQGAANYLNDDDYELSQFKLDVEDYYGSVFKSMVTLFKSVTGGTIWGPVVDALNDLSWFYTWIFFAYIGFTIFAVLNLVTGVFVDAAMQSSCHERDLVSEQQVKQDMNTAAHLREIFFDMADSDDGYLDIDQFREYLQDEYVSSYMKALKLNTSDATQLFRLLDMDNSGEILVDEFVEGCMKLRGEAKGMDVHIMICENRRMISKFGDFVEYAEEQFEHLKEKQDKLNTEITMPGTGSQTPGFLQRAMSIQSTFQVPSGAGKIGLLTNLEEEAPVAPDGFKVKAPAENDHTSTWESSSLEDVSTVAAKLLDKSRNDAQDSLKPDVPVHPFALTPNQAEKKA